MSNSMIINDIFDSDVDKINKPNRIIPSGKIKSEFAILIASIIFVTTNVLSALFLKDIQTYIIFITNLSIVLYTPIFKKIPLLKNIFCATVITTSLYFSGLSTNNVDTNNILLIISMIYLFFGTISREILMDTFDVEGDKKNNIKTLPVIFGKHASIKFAYLSFYTGIVVSSFLIFKNLNPIFVFPFLGINIMWIEQLKLNYNNTHKKILNSSVIDNSVILMTFSLMYFLCLSSLLIKFLY
jgi:geranylgeranylglycerol-phosphate geranylgeranyltransferase